MRWTIAAVIAAVSVALTGVMANASTPMKAPSATTSTAIPMPTGQQAKALHRALVQLRATNPAFRHMGDAQILAEFRDHLHTDPVTDSSSGTVHTLVTGWGTGTLWFSRSDVAWYATAGTTAVIALLLYLGIVSWEAWPIVGSLIATFWAAWGAGRCVWLTYRKPRSWGSYAC